jgi:hypothetical protein
MGVIKWVICMFKNDTTSAVAIAIMMIVALAIFIEEMKRI